MLNPDDLKPCSSCEKLFGRYRVGFEALFSDAQVFENWLSEDIHVCTLCKRDPAMHVRWLKMYRKNRPWTKGKDSRPDDPVAVELMFEDQLVANGSPDEA